MTASELTIHVLAQAALRYFTDAAAAEASELTEPQVLAELSGALASLTPAELHRAGEDLLNVCRYLRDRDRPEAAEQVALVVSKAAKSKLVAHGAVALLVPPEPEGERASGTLLAPPDADPMSERSPGFVELYWPSMSEDRREHLAQLADQVLERMK